jgi:hypothetical protein
MGTDAVRHKLDVLREHCAAVGRPYDQIEKTTLDSLVITRDGRDDSLSPEAAIEYFAGLADLGIDQAIFSLRNVADPEPFDLLATRIIPAVEQLSVAGR